MSHSSRLPAPLDAGAAAPDARLAIREIFGLSPWRERFREAARALRGDGESLPSEYDRTSLVLLRPRLSIPLWLGRRPRGRRVPISNHFSHVQPPRGAPWSVRVTTARDFRGLRNTYDSHNGTDFATPPGTKVVAAASGRVLRISREFDRGGLKVFVDHGRGLVTTSNHLARALVRVGDFVERGQPIALSGSSGLDGFLLFPWLPPHVHFNVWLNGVPVDPFARPGEIALWRTGNEPVPFRPGDRLERREEASTDWDAAAVERAVAGCRGERTRSILRSEPDLARRSMDVLFYSNYYPVRFPEMPRLYPVEWPRIPWLDLPFSPDDYDGIETDAPASPWS